MNAACNVEKQRLMNAIYQCGFAISDITLFLDTHPKDPDALDYFHHMKHKYNHFVAEYETKFGPLPRPENKDRIIGSGPCHRGHGKGGTINSMWKYEKRLQYPVCITKSNPAIAKIIISQFGGPDGELSASMRYLSQRYAMPYREVAGLLTDIGTEELAQRRWK